MKKYILGALFTFCLLLSPVFAPPAEATSLTSVQVNAIIQLLQTLGVDQSVIDTIQTALSGESTTPSGTSPTASLTVNGQPSVTNADPLVPRTWGWSSTKGTTYSASGNITGCDTTSQNGPQQNWKPWTDTKATGNATNGSSSVIPGTVKYGCVIVGTYNVTKDGKTTTATATITYKHADGSANTTTVVADPSSSSGGPNAVRIAIITTSLPDAKVGEPYSATILIHSNDEDSSGNQLIIRSILPPGLSFDFPGGTSGVISGVPTDAGAYPLNPQTAIWGNTNVGDGKYITLLVTPRTQTLASLNADIVQAYSGFNWSTATAAQSAISFTALMKQKGWKVDDVSVATGYNIATLRSLLNIDWAITHDEILWKVNSFDWSPENVAVQSAVSFRAIMSQKGWSIGQVSDALGVLTGIGILHYIAEAVVTVSNSASGPFVTNGTVYNNLPVYTRIRAPGIDIKMNAPQGCIQPVGTFGCSSNSGYRDYLPSEWLANDTIQTIIQDPSMYPLTTYELWIKYRTGSPIKAGTLTLLPGTTSSVSSAPTLHISSLSPSSGPVGTAVTVNGSGFTGANNIYLDGVPVDTDTSSGGSTPTWIAFTIPVHLPSCPAWDRLCVGGPLLSSGSHTVSVQNTNGTSNTVSLGVN